MVTIKGGAVGGSVPTKYTWYIDANNYEYAKLNGTTVEIWRKQNGAAEILVGDYPA